MKYDIDYFIKKFESIPAEKWTRGIVLDWEGRSCALGHCGVRDNALGGGWTKTEEADALESILRANLVSHNVPVLGSLKGEISGYRFWRINDRCGKVYDDSEGIKAGVVAWLKAEKERLDALNQT